MIELRKKETGLSIPTIAFLYIGALLGAGFASGQEIMKFFSAYGEKGKFGIIVCSILFCIIALMVLKLGAVKKTNKMELVIAPFDNAIVITLVKIVLTYYLFIIFIAMLAAGGSIFTQFFGLPSGVGGLLILFLVLFVNAHGFQSIANVLKYTIPVMLVLALGISLYIWIKSPGTGSFDASLIQSPLAPNWIISAFLYVSYNSIVAVPILSTIGESTRYNRNAKIGALLGSLVLGISAFCIYQALEKNLAMASTFDLPMLYLAQAVSAWIYFVYFIVLMGAIYSAAVSCFYGISNAVTIQTPWRRLLTLVVIGVAAYIISLVGFENMVTYAYPIQGYLCFVLLGCIFISFYRHVIKGKDWRVKR